MRQQLMFAAMPLQPQNLTVRNRQLLAALDAAGQEAWIRLKDQEVHTLGEAAQRDEDAFCALVQALLRAGYNVDYSVRALAGLDTNCEEGFSCEKTVSKP